MEESQAQIISFTPQEAKDALLAYAKQIGKPVSDFSGFEIRVANGNVHILLFGPTTKGLGTMPTAGSA
jgi:hypothetical protein